MRFAHPANGSNLVMERLPVISLVDRRPDRFNLFNQHRLRRIIAPVFMIVVSGAISGQYLGQFAARVLATTMCEEESIGL